MLIINLNASIEGPIFIGRSWAEYISMFDLNLDKLENKKILDCAAGASSFTAYMSERDFDVTAIDILYDKDYLFLQERCNNHLNALINALDKIKKEFSWTYFKDLTHLKKHRVESCRDFSSHYKKDRGKSYIKADLTALPFSDNCFDLVLCAHLLFIYDHRLDWQFHLDAIMEMVRVSSDEVRIYPLVKHKGEKSVFVDKIIDELSADHKVMIDTVDYEFRKGGNEMLKIKKKTI